MTSRFVRPCLAAALLGCSGTTSPNPAGNRQFKLVTADEHALPSIVFDGTIAADTAAPFHLRVTATSGTMSIDSLGHYEQRVMHDVELNGAPSGSLRRADRGECTTVGDALQCVSNYIEGIEFAGTLAHDTVTIVQDLVGEGRPVTYRYARAGSTAP